MGLVKLFNLYIQPDAANPTLFYIEPCHAFYAGTSYYTPQTVDWTTKLDLSRPIEQDPMGDLKGKVYRFTYKSDSDFWNTLYTHGGTENSNGSATGRSSHGWNEVYGQYACIINTDFQTDDYMIETLFSPTPLVSYDIDNTLPLPVVLSSKLGNAPFSVEAALGQYNLYAGNLRLLYYGGLKNCTLPWYLTEDNNNTPAYGGAFTTYPYAGHLDDPYTPTLDLNYNMPYEVYYNAVNYTSNNLFNMYWAGFIAQTTDANSKLVTASFRLTANDILHLDFRNQYFVDGHYYYLHTINDYNPMQESLTKVTLLKVNTALSLTTAQRTQTVNRTLGRIVGATINSMHPVGWPVGSILPVGAVLSAGVGAVLQVGYITGTNIRDKVVNGILYGGKASTLSFPFKVLTGGNDIAQAHIIGSNIIHS